MVTGGRRKQQYAVVNGLDKDKGGNEITPVPIMRLENTRNCRRKKPCSKPLMISGQEQTGVTFRMEGFWRLQRF